jgi:hypothetical protein
MSSDKKSASSYEIHTTVLVIANVVAILFYLLAAAPSWVNPELADIPGAAGGGAVIWFLLAVPIFYCHFYRISLHCYGH